MATIYVLVVVDVEGTTSSGSLANNVWMLDTEKYLGETEATNSLTTYAKSGDRIQWTLASINPGDDLQFPAGMAQPFTSIGNTVPAIINPKAVPDTDDQYIGHFSPPGGTAAGTTYQYSMILSMDGKNYTFDPYLKLFAAT